MIIKPFRGLRPRSDLASAIASVPYDVVDSAEARSLAAGDEHTFLHVIRPEIDLPEDADPYGDDVYAKGRENLHAMIERGWMVRDDEPAYYVYRLTMDGQTQTGILGAAAVDDYVAGRIKKHEHTRPQKENDRVRLNDALGATPGPIFLTYRALPELNALVNGVVDRTPAADFTAVDGVRHEVWVVRDAATRDKMQELLEKVPATYVADGHHRTAAAARVCATRIGRLEEPTGEEPCRYFLAAHFPADQLRVFDYNRVVRDLNGLTAEAFVERVQVAGFHVRARHGSRRPSQPGTFGMYLDGRWSLLTAGPELLAENDPVRRLDVSILADHLLAPILGVEDPRTDARIDFVGGIRGMDELERRVDSGTAAVAFALYPTQLEDVMAVADAGRVMPPKSTWFEPKLRSGLVVQMLDAPTL